jgi:predicted house-cleaning noncanonical NTP pyrophosphatase (MazG superfamily)
MSKESNHMKEITNQNKESMSYLQDMINRLSQIIDSSNTSNTNISDSRVSQQEKMNAFGNNSNNDLCGM